MWDIVKLPTKICKVVVLEEEERKEQKKNI